MGVSSWVLLRLEESIEVPEAALYVIVGRHFLKAHLYEDLSELASHLQNNKPYFSPRRQFADTSDG